MAPTRLFDRFRGGTAPGGRVAAPTAPLAAAPAGAADRPIARSPGRQWEGGDPITRLPELAAKKLARLRRQHSEAGVLLRDLDEKRARAGEAKQRAEANVD